MTNVASLSPTGVLICLMVEALVDHADEVVVSERIDGDRTVITVDVAESDIGKIIGKSGRTARSMRTILACAGQKIGRRHDLFLVDRKRAKFLAA